MSHYVDEHVGQCIRRRRLLTGMTQVQLAEAVGVRFQQILKYEYGRNRVSASCLFKIAHALGIPISYFFDSLDKHECGELAETATAKNKTAVRAELFQSKEAIEFLNCYYRCSEKERLALLDLTKSLTTKTFPPPLDAQEKTPATGRFARAPDRTASGAVATETVRPMGLRASNHRQQGTS